MDRELAVSQLFRDGLAAGSHREHLLEQTVCRGIERFGLVHDPADVDVDVVRHVARGPHVAGDLDDRRDGIAGRRAQARREHDDLRTAADHAGDRLDVEARRVHHRQPLANDRAGVGHDILERRALSALVCGPERLLLDRRQTAADVPRRRLRAADVEAERTRFGFDAGDDLDQLRRGRRLRRPRRQQVLGAHDLGDLTEHGAAAERRPDDR